MCWSAQWKDLSDFDKGHIVMDGGLGQSNSKAVPKQEQKDESSPFDSL